MPLLKRPAPSDLTIVIPTLGRKDFLPAAVKSLLLNTPPGVSLVVFFNAPGDESLVKEVEPLVANWNGPAEIKVSTDRVDIAASHNRALAEVKTEFVTFMGDDDLVLEPRVQQILDVFWETTPTPAVVGSFCRRVSGTARAPRFSTNKDYGPATIAEWEQFRDSGEPIEVVFPATYFRTELLRDIGGFDARFDTAMDIGAFTILGQHAPVLAHRRRSFAHRIHGGSLTAAAPANHDQRLRYIKQYMKARRNGEPEPDLEEFRKAEASGSTIKRFANKRATLSAALFRQGGSSVASGSKSKGVVKIGASMVLSPSKFLERAKAQGQNESGQPIVTFLLKNCNQYRVPFFHALRTILEPHGVEIRLVVADGLPEDQAKGDVATITWAEVRHFKSINIRGRSLLWQPGFDLAASSDLIITEQANKQLFNFVLTFGKRFFKAKHAFWGHGRNFHIENRNSKGEKVKRAMTRRVHWFFAYNNMSGDAVLESGLPAERITNVMNATDTNQIRHVRSLLEPDIAKTVRAELGMGQGPVGLYLGGIYDLKRPEYLVAAAEEIRKLVPDFEMLVIGSGTSAHIVADAAEKYDWFHHAGAQYGDERVRLASVASIQLMPGLVGLNVVDGFALGLPTITTEYEFHSPEIEYLSSDENGIILPLGTKPPAFATAVAELLGDEERLKEMATAANVTGMELTIEAMAENFAAGVLQALETAKR